MGQHQNAENQRSSKMKKQDHDLKSCRNAKKRNELCTAGLASRTSATSTSPQLQPGSAHIAAPQTCITPFLHCHSPYTCIAPFLHCHLEASVAHAKQAFEPPEHVGQTSVQVPQLAGTGVGDGLGLGEGTGVPAQSATLEQETLQFVLQRPPLLPPG